MTNDPICNLGGKPCNVLNRQGDYIGVSRINRTRRIRGGLSKVLIPMQEVYRSQHAISAGIPSCFWFELIVKD